MKLSNINNKELSDTEIQKIVYDGIDDNGHNSVYGLVFGNSMLIKERVATAVEAYKNKRIQKVIFSGGSNGISNQNNDTTPEAIKMKNLAIKMGIKEEDILVEDKSNNSFENVDNTFKLIQGKNVTSLAIISSEFHLKRCMAIIKKKKPQKGFLVDRQGLEPWTP